MKACIHQGNRQDLSQMRISMQGATNRIGITASYNCNYAYACTHTFETWMTKGFKLCMVCSTSNIAQQPSKVYYSDLSMYIRKTNMWMYMFMCIFLCLST